jgi:hypothetical protein
LWGCPASASAAVYHLTGDKAEARAKAEDITIEQTIEFPADLAPEGDIRDHIIGRIERLLRLNRAAGRRSSATLSRPPGQTWRSFST